MKDRLLTFALAAAAFALFYVLLAPKRPPPQERVTRPTTTEKGPNGYYALEQWLRRAGFSVMSLRERFVRLDAMDGAGQGNLLITTVPYVHPLRHSETQPLRAWVARGNTLLVLAGLSDTPEWSKVQDPGFMTSIEAMTGLTFIQDFAKVAENGEASEPAREKAPTEGSAAEAENALRNDEPRRYELRPNGAHPLLKGVNLVSALSEYPTAKWRAALGPDRLLLEL
ncbi:MAG TPA: DUF4350 domain-containing protein, partial [Steroidobacter sp.]|nr:DUF4350 domain-containing protein [Steroidobacter sp.]